MNYYYHICLEDSTYYFKRLTFKSFLIRKVQGISFLDGPTSRFAPYQLSLLHHPSLIPTKAKSYTEVHGGKLVSNVLWPPDLVRWLCLQKRFVMTSPRQPETGRVKIKMKLTIQNRQAQTGLVSSVFTLIINVKSAILSDVEGTTQRWQEAEKHEDSGNNTFDEIVSITWQMQHRSLARELSRNIREPRNCQNLWAAMLMVASHMSSSMTSAVVWQNAQLLKNYKIKYLGKGSFHNLPPKSHM